MCTELEGENFERNDERVVKFPKRKSQRFKIP